MSVVQRLEGKMLQVLDENRGVISSFSEGVTSDPLPESVVTRETTEMEMPDRRDHLERIERLRACYGTEALLEQP